MDSFAPKNKDDLAEGLIALFGDLRACFQNEGSTSDRLPQFMDALRQCRFGTHETFSHFSAVEGPCPVGLAEFLEKLRNPLKSWECNDAIGNPWSAAALNRDEVRNASVLAWFLDPRGGHGLGDSLLREFLAEIGRKHSFPGQSSCACTVNVEAYPDGLRSNRVDIQIDDPGGFFLIIEVKIDAFEQPDQLNRYCGIAEKQACDGRPWAVVYLTLSGESARTAGQFGDKVVPVAWTSVSKVLRSFEPTNPKDGHAAVSRYLANAFAAHVSSFYGGRFG